MDNHDGCLGCKYENKEEFEFPCSHCRGTIDPSNPIKDQIADLYVPEENANPFSRNGLLLVVTIQMQSTENAQLIVLM